VKGLSTDVETCVDGLETASLLNAVAGTVRRGVLVDTVAARDVSRGVVCARCGQSCGYFDRRGKVEGK
jgi:hypothetical protein